MTPAPQPPKKADTPAPDQSGSGGTPVDAPGGSVAYGYERTNGERTIELYTFSPATGVWTTTGASYNSTAQGNPTTGFIGGAVDLATGTYYAGGYDGSRFNIFRYNAGSNSISFVGFISVGEASASNGDMAFDAAGNLFVVRGYGTDVAIYSVTRANLLAATGSTTVAVPTATFETFGAMNKAIPLVCRLRSLDHSQCRGETNSHSQNR